MRVLLVEDEPYMAEAIRDGLRLEAIAADIAGDGHAALELLSVNDYDVAVLDRDIPGPSGDEVAKRIVASNSGVLILMLTAADRLDDKASGFELGADDYLTKPFSPRELVLRVQSILRRSVTDLTPEAAFELGGFVLDPSARVVSKNGQVLTLSAREFDLFAFLLKHPSQAFSREQLLKSVWHWDFGDLSTVTVTVRRVREKIEDDPTNPTILETVWGVGYRLTL